MDIAQRIKELRIQNKMTQSELAQKIGISYVQVGRYETKKSTPSSDILQKLADTLDTTADFLMNGTHNEVVASQLLDKELLEQYKRIEKLSVDDKHLVKRFLNSFLLSVDIQKTLML